MDYTFTVFCKLPNTPRGVYDEEIDVVVRTKSIVAAKQAAQHLINEGYHPDLRPVKAVWRPVGLF